MPGTDSHGFTFAESAFKHGFDEESILNAIYNPLSANYFAERSVVIVLGFDKQGNTLEVAYDMASRLVFHAMKRSRL